MCYKKEIVNTGKEVVRQFIEAEKKLSAEQKTMRLAMVSFGLASYAAIKTMVNTREMKRRLKRCEKRITKLEDKSNV